jgi:hypothetical protein
MRSLAFFIVSAMNFRLPVLNPQNQASSKSWIESWLAVMMLIYSCLSSAQAHPSDISYLRVQVQPHQVEMRFTFNLLSLTRFASIDANQDQRIEKAELDAAALVLNEYFNEHIELHLNEKKTALGLAQPFECVWPETDGSSTVSEVDYPVRYVDITFIHEVTPILADLWLGFDLWPQTGPLSSIEATYEQDDLITQVPFSQSEPEFLYDTGYAAKDIFQEQDASHPLTKAKTPILFSWVIPAFALILAIVFLGTKLARFRSAGK